MLADQATRQTNNGEAETRKNANGTNITGTLIQALLLQERRVSGAHISTTCVGFSCNIRLLCFTSYSCAVPLNSEVSLVSLSKENTKVTPTHTSIASAREESG